MTNPVRFSTILILALCFLTSSNAECIAFLQNGPSNFLNTGKLTGPIVFSYDENDAIVYRYPDIDTGCVYRPGDTRLHLSCAGNPMIFAGQSRDYTSTYLYRERRNPSGLAVHGENSWQTTVECSSPPESTFIDTSTTSDIAYQIGYYVQPGDFLKVLEFRVQPSNGRFVVKAILTPLAAALSLKSTKDRASVSKSFVHGIALESARSFFNYRLAYAVNNQRTIFEGHWPQLEDSFDPINMTQRLVATQLISEDDFYYLNQKSATYFYENSVPVWTSIAEGNWRRVGRLMREIAAQTGSEFDLYAKTSDNYVDAQGKPVMLAPENEHEGPQSALLVPKVLQRYMIDRKNPSRGIVYQVVNDPFMSKDEIEAWLKRQPKCRAVECHVHQPEFLDPWQGYTYCCEIGD